MSTNGSKPLLDVEGLVASYPVGRGLVGAAKREPKLEVHAVDGVSFSLSRGEMLALVGESGCGKTSTAQSVLRLIETSGGSIRFDGEEITRLSSKALRPLRRRMQIVYQDPYESLDPRFRVGATIEEPLEVHKIESVDRPQLAGLVGTEPVRVRPERVEVVEPTGLVDRDALVPPGAVRVDPLRISHGCTSTRSASS